MPAHPPRRRKALPWSGYATAWDRSSAGATALALLSVSVVGAVMMRGRGARLVQSAAAGVALEAIGATLLVITAITSPDAPTDGVVVALVAVLAIVAGGAIARLQMWRLAERPERPEQRP